MAPLALLTIFTLLAFVSQSSSIGGASRLIGSADLRDLPPLGVLEAAFFANLGLFYYMTFRASGLAAEPVRFTLLASAGNFINLVSKSNGFGALPLFIGEGRRSEAPRTRVVLAYGVTYALGEVAFLTVLVAAGLTLYLSGGLTATEGAAMGIVLAMTLVIGLIVAFVLRSEHSLHRLYRMANVPLGLWAKIRRRPALDARGALRVSAAETLEAARFIAGRRAQFALPFLSAIAVELMSATFVLFSADLLGVHLSFQTALAGYVISLVFTILSFTPGGLGFAEGSLAAFLVSQGLDRPDAIAVTLIFRFFTYWLPLLVGALCFLYLQWRNARDGHHSLPQCA